MRDDTAIYFISGKLPAPWEDFMLENKDLGLPNFTIRAGDKDLVERIEEGWVDIITSQELTAQHAMELISKEIDRPVAIRQLAQVMSI